MRYSIVLNKKGLEDVDLAFSDADDVAKLINADEFMEDFQIEGDESHLVLTGSFREEVLDDYGSPNNAISEMETMRYIKHVRKSRLE